jgi:hypothetical protein
VITAPGLVACAGNSAAESGPSGTVEHVGELPDRFLVPSAAGTVPTVPTARVTPASTVADTVGEGTRRGATEPTAAAVTAAGSSTPAEPARFADEAAGNRLLVIGDSISASIGPAFDNQLCDDLGRRGWFVGVDAVEGRDSAGGLEAVQRQLGGAQVWDAAIVNLGSNYRGDPVAYATDLRRMLDLLRPRPVIVVTATEWQGRVAEVNYVIRELTRGREGVWVLEWSERTRADDSLLDDDGLHVTDAGGDLLASLLGDLAGPAPDAPTSAFPACVLLGGGEGTTTVPSRTEEGD